MKADGLWLVLVPVTVGLAAPANRSEINYDLYEVSQAYEEELATSIGDTRILYEPIAHFRTVAFRYSRKKWPNGVVPFLFDHGFRYVDEAKSVMREFHRYSCVRWRFANSGEEYVNFTSREHGCWSDLGYQSRQSKGKPAQMVHLGDGCGSIGTIKHEMMHTLGFRHEHQRADRDNYVSINYDNIRNGKKDNFEKIRLQDYSHWYTPYDYESVMHYPLDAFSKGQDLPSMVVKRDIGEKRIGYKRDFSLLDIYALNRVYEC